MPGHIPPVGATPPRPGRLKFCAPRVDDRRVSTATVYPHQARGSQSELMAWARYWEWERAIKIELPRIIADTDLRILHQPIFWLGSGVPVARGFEALSRFPVHPRIPVGLWFRTARDMGIGRDLELAAVRAALEPLERVSGKAFLSVNASLDTVPRLIDVIPNTLASPLIIDLPYAALNDPRSGELCDALRDCGATIAIDDVPIEDLHVLRPSVLALGPDCIKVDVLTGLSDDPMARFNLADGSAWCRGAGIRLIAERVDHVDDLAILYELGVEWAQGYCLSRPVLL
jgi:EAL domain-containing protein (putative c-di-GMP-specific phosphodiesterase class I)